MKTDVLFVMGPTNVGKSHLIDYAVKQHGAYAVSVGRMLRSKYGPDYFKGQQAPEHTRVEACKMMLEGVKKGIASGRKLVLVDGQPREDIQIQAIHEVMETGDLVDKVNFCFVQLTCPDNIRKQRLVSRDMDASSLRLSQQRFDRDVEELQKITDKLIALGWEGRINTIDSTNDEQEFDDLYKMLSYHHQKVGN